MVKSVFHDLCYAARYNNFCYSAFAKAMPSNFLESLWEVDIFETAAFTEHVTSKYSKRRRQVHVCDCSVAKDPATPFVAKLF